MLLWSVKLLFDVETVSARVEQGCTTVTQHIAPIDVYKLWFVSSSETNLSHNHPSQVETLGVGGIVGPIASLSNLVCLWYISTEQDQDAC